MSILNMSFTGGVFILAVLLLRAAFQNIVSRRTFLILWLVADALLLIPFRFRLPFSFYSLIKGPDTSSFVQAAAAQTMTAVSSRGLPWWQIIWIAGGTILLAVVLSAHCRNLWRFRKAVPVAVHPADVPTWVRVKTLAGLPSPLAFGIFRPTILIPAEDFASAEQLRHIYLHELCHIRHLDIARRYLMLFALAVHWFNPLVWIMYYVASQDMEMRCDEQVIRQIGTKKSYATTLVAMETGKLQHLLDAGFSFSSTGSRLKAILKAKRLPVISLVLALLLTVSAIVFFASDAARNASAEPEQPAAMQSADPPASQPAPVIDPEPTIESTFERETVPVPATKLEPEQNPESEAKPDPVPVPSEEPAPLNAEAPVSPFVPDLETTAQPASAPDPAAPSSPVEPSVDEDAEHSYVTVPLPNGMTTEAYVPGVEPMEPDPWHMPKDHDESDEYDGLKLSLPDSLSFQP